MSASDAVHGAPLFCIKVPKGAKGECHTSDYGFMTLKLAPVINDRERPAPELRDSLPEPDADRPKPATVTRTTPLAPTPPPAW